jgi:hypothetical protein
MRRAKWVERASLAARGATPQTPRRLFGQSLSLSLVQAKKRTTVERCRGTDLSQLQVEALLKAGRPSSPVLDPEAGRQVASVGDSVGGGSRPERVILLFRHKKGHDTE